jgi:hypothetical protein
MLNLYMYIYEAQQHTRSWIVKRLRANTSIMPPFIHHRYIYRATTIHFGWVIDFTWMNLFFHPRNENFGKCSSSIHVVESFTILFHGYLNRSLGIFLCRRNEMWKNDHQRKQYTIENHE